MKVLLTGGGTAGHINPALAIADHIKAKEPDAQILFIGTRHGLESTLVPKAGYDIKYVNVEGLSKKINLKNIKSFCHLLTAKTKCKKIIKDFKPDIVIGTGGYVCAPAVMAANSMHIPTIIHEQNVFPGKAIKLLSKKSTVTAISFEDSRKYLSDAQSILFTGNPIRPEIISTTSGEARKAMDLGTEKLILIFGGSLGADTINRVALQYIQTLSSDDNKKVIFATGEKNYKAIFEKAREMGISDSPHAQIVPYIHNMNEVMNAADIAVCRSGAITVSELSALAKPAIFVPSPNVTNNHQEYNARAISDRGGAITILERDFNLKTLSNALNSVLYDDEAMQKMKHQSSILGCVDALDIIYKKIKELT